jgi:UDP-N-acetylglucosamine 4,6-dehydratase/5-epimerase
MLNNSSNLITVGMGSFGHTFVLMTLAKYNPMHLVIFSRDEIKNINCADEDLIISSKRNVL